MANHILIGRAPVDAARASNGNYVFREGGPALAGRSSLEPDRETLESWLRTFATAALDHLDELPTASAAGHLGPEAAAITEATSRPIGEEPFAGGAAEL